MTNFLYRATVIIPVADRAVAQDIWKGIDPVGWADTFTSRLSGDGNNPPTHYVCSSAITKDNLAVLETLANNIPNAEINISKSHRLGVQADIDTKFNKPHYDNPNKPRTHARVGRGQKDPHAMMAEHSIKPIND